MKYIIPHEVITSFLEHSVNNVSTRNGCHIETLAFLIGRKDEDIIAATHIIFPKQHGTSTYVDDMG